MTQPFAFVIPAIWTSPILLNLIISYMHKLQRCASIKIAYACIRLSPCLKFSMCLHMRVTIERTESCLEVEFKPVTFQIKIFAGSIKQQVLRSTNPIADG